MMDDAVLWQLACRSCSMVQGALGERKCLITCSVLQILFHLFPAETADKSTQQSILDAKKKTRLEKVGCSLYLFSLSALWSTSFLATKQATCCQIHSVVTPFGCKMLFFYIKGKTQFIFLKELWNTFSFEYSQRCATMHVQESFRSIKYFRNIFSWYQEELVGVSFCLKIANYYISIFHAEQMWLNTM